MALIRSRFLTPLALTALPAVLLCSLSPAWADPVVSLGSASTFAVLAGTTVTNTDPSIINGNVGAFPGTAITGFGPGPGQLGPGIVNGTQYAGPGPASAAQTDLTTAYGDLAALACGTHLTGSDLGALAPLNPGVYCFSTSAQLTGTLVLNENSLDNQEFVFQIGTGLNTASNAAVTEINPGPTAGGADSNIFWQIGSSVTLGTGTEFLGNIVALTSISLGTGAGIACGAALARNGAVTLDDNVITTCQASDTNAPPNPSVVPAPGSLALLGLGLFGLTGFAGIGRRNAV